MSKRNSFYLVLSELSIMNNSSIIFKLFLILFLGWNVAWGESLKEESSLYLNYHLMHPGGDSRPADPNAAFYSGGLYHLHYIIAHPYQGIINGRKSTKSFSYIHVTSPDMLHWSWQETKLQPSTTGHGMYSGTGFKTKQGLPAVIYHGAGSGSNQIVIAKNNKMNAWHQPFPVKVFDQENKPYQIRHWDPDCFLIGDFYYAFSGGQNPPLIKSKDLKRWTYVGPFFKHEPDDVVLGEDVSCGNFFRLGEKWMLLCISHQYGCRYYIGDWDSKNEQFIPDYHDRMNWRSDFQDFNHLKLQTRDIFAPESLLTPDGRRVMWAWSATLNETLLERSIQTLPRELSLGKDGRLRIQPLKELKNLRDKHQVIEDVKVQFAPRTAGGQGTSLVSTLDGDAYEIRITVDRKQAMRKRFGVRLFSSEEHVGLPIYIQPNNQTIRVGNTEAPFSVSDLPPGEDVEITIYTDKYFVEVFVNNRRALVAADMQWRDANELRVYSYGAPTTFKRIDIWSMKPSNQGFLKALQSPNWEPDTN